MDEFKYVKLSVLFMSEGRMDPVFDRGLAVNAHAIMVAKRELSQKAKISIYWSIYVPTLTYGHGMWVVTEITRLQIQATKTSFLLRMSSLSF